MYVHLYTLFGFTPNSVIFTLKIYFSQLIIIIYNVGVDVNIVNIITDLI